ncbi:PREDICTED: protein NDRG1-like [Acropora digitifera]|uniref:protein NDRG1-like n=1 Tax=Acropora digitifera TaxID=70779 RepID=UPI00077AF746|nr:PREDICTED: protein NDRG1-like [Acropora digitifera]
MTEKNQITEKVEKVGDLTVFIVGEESREKQEEKENIRKKDVMITFHDVGMNHKTCFGKFFQHMDIQGLLDRFTIYHIDAPGQESNAENLAPGYQYPSMVKLGEMVGNVIDHFNLNDVVCFGVGAGANVLTELAVSKWGEKIAGLVVVEPGISTASFKEWSEGKIKTRQLDKKGFTPATVNYLMWHHFERDSGKPKVELVDKFAEDLDNEHLNAHNVAEFVKAYNARSDLMKDMKGHRIDTQTGVLVVTGEHSPHRRDTENKFYYGDVLKQTDAKIKSLLTPDCGASVLEEQPAKVAEGLILFIQGLGLVPTLRTRSMSGTTCYYRSQSMSED